MRNFDFLAEAARPFFVAKICICGTESSGKSILTKFLAEHFKTNYVEECADFV